MKPPIIKNIKTTPFWWEAAEPEYISSAVVPTEGDVGIIGAGFAGITAALLLARAGRNVVVFDSMRPGEGASTRNGGICSGNVKYSFKSLIQTAGLEHAKAIFSEGIEARKALSDFIFHEDIDCDFSPVGRFDGANSHRDYEALEIETDLLNKHLNFGAEMITKNDQYKYIGTDVYSGGRFRPDVAGLHPGKFYKGLLQKALDAGVTVLNKTKVIGLEEEAKKFVVQTPFGKTNVRACIVATNGYTTEVTKWLRRRIISIPSQIVATEILSDEMMAILMPKKCMIGDTRNLYNYYRPSPDGRRLIFGGRRGADTNDNIRKCFHLYKNLVEIFPEIEGIKLTHTWWGYTGYTFDFFPHLAVHNNIHYATGFCGSGVVWAPWLGRKVAEIILNDKKTVKTVFSQNCFPTRRFYSGNPWFVPLLIKWYGFKDLIKYGRSY